MRILLKGLIAFLIGVIVAYIVGTICKHYAVDLFWGWLAGVIAGLVYFVYGPLPSGPAPRL